MSSMRYVRLVVHSDTMFLSIKYVVKKTRDGQNRNNSRVS